MNSRKTILDATKSVPNPSAQSSGVLHPGNDEIQLYKSINTWLKVNKEYPKHVKVVIELQLNYGLRISEVLGIVPNDVSENGKIRIRISKSGGIIYVQSIMYNDWWINVFKRCNLMNIWNSRWFYYRLYNKYGWTILKDGNINKSVTHSMRQIQATMLENQYGNKESIKTVLNHKSIKSSQYYGTNRSK